MRIHSLLVNICCITLPVAAGIAFAASLSSADKQFLITAARTDMTEAHEGQMAADQANRSDVKEFGKTLVQDHTEAYWHLKELASKTGVTIPDGINTARDAQISGLMRLKGNSFDRRFARDEVAAHRQALAAFEREAKQGHDPEVKDYAGRMIPVLQKHLHLAEECAKPSGRS